MSIKDELFQHLWTDLKIDDFEKWLFSQDSKKFEDLIGVDTYLDIISENYSFMSINQIKRYLFERLNDKLKEDWNKFVLENYQPIIGLCKKTNLLDYSGTNIRDWDLKIGHKYEIIEIIKSSKENSNHKEYVRYVDREIDLYPSGLIPKDLFEINLEDISDLYLVHKTGDSIEIEPKDWSKSVYKPKVYSFWEDFYNDEPKAVMTYYKTLDKLGIKNAW